MIKPDIDMNEELHTVMSKLSVIDNFKKLAFVLIHLDIQNVKLITGIRDGVELYSQMVDEKIDTKQIVFQMVAYNTPVVLNALNKLGSKIYQSSHIEKLIVEELGTVPHKKKIQAIKLHRVLTGSSLMDAKVFVEDVIEKLSQ